MVSYPEHLSCFDYVGVQRYFLKQRTEQPLWQRYGYERVLRKEEATVDVARYIVNNPIRSRLVERIEDYAFWGSLTHSREELLEYIRAT